MDDENQRGTKREYYIHRKGRSRSLSLRQIKTLFIEVLRHLALKQYLLEAKGFRGPNFDDYGIWGRDIPMFILKHLQLENIWPFDECLPKYDETTFFTVIEFIFDYVSKPVHRLGRIVSFEKEPAQLDYRTRVNEILDLYIYYYGSRNRITTKKAFELSEEGEIREKAQEGLEKLLEEIPPTDDSENIDDKIRYAKSRFLRYGATVEEKKEAVRTLGDVLEFLKKSNIRMPKHDDSDLFHIINRFSIRHHNRLQKSDYTTDVWYDFLFYFFLATIQVLLRLEARNGS